MLSLHQLLCEYAVNPLGIDANPPRLSWIASAAGRDQNQTAYQILASSTEEKLRSGVADLWDSGKVTANSMLVDYAGAQLRSRQRCWWKVRAWDGGDIPGEYSEPAWFEMGLLKPEDWLADWISFPGAWPGKALYFRREFQLEKPVQRARVYMCGLGWSELHINGQRVNDRVLDPPQSNYTKRLLYSTDVVEAFLRPGKNVIGVICGNGWFGTVRLLFQMHIDYMDGTQEVILRETGHARPWKVAPGPILANSVFDGEVYDARLEQPNWDAPDGELNHAAIAANAEGPSGKRVAASLEPIRVVETLRPQKMTEPHPGVYVFDLGQNFAGWARLRAQGPAGTQITLRFAESLYPDGTVNQENLRYAKAQDVYILKGSGLETWEPRFTYHGFRYIQVEGWPGAPDLGSIDGRVVRSAVESSGAFECSSDLLNRIHKMIRWTETSNLHSLPTDCPQRDERMGWLNDMAARSEEALHNYNLARLFAKWTADIEDEQSSDGAITDTAPYRWGRRPADPVSVCYLLIPWLLYVHYGDKKTMSARYAGMKAWVDYLTRQARDHILSYSYYGDWAPPVQWSLSGSIGSSAVSKETPGELVSTACYAYSARLLSQIAAVLGKQADSENYTQLSAAIAGQFNNRFWHEHMGGYGTNNQSCNAIAYYMGLVPEKRKERVIASLAANVIEKNAGHLTTGNICTKYLLESLTSGGRPDVAYQIAAQESYPSWGFMLANGATTLWERWELATGSGMNSHNHPMLASIGAWFYRAVAGIQADPEGPGFERFCIRPNLENELTYAKAALQTIRGNIEVSWRASGGSLSLDLTVPVGSQARVYIPYLPASTLSESGNILWQNDHAAQEGKITLEQNNLILTIGSGEYHFLRSAPKPD